MNLTSVEKLLFTKHVGVMLRSGISLTDALESLLEQPSSGAFKKILKSILNTVRNGQKLSEAMAKFPHSFDKFYISLIKIGEESGTLAENLNHLGQKLSKDYNLKRKIQGVTFYPAMIIIAASVMCIGLSIFILPQLADLFSSLDVTLPLSTKIVMWLARVMKNYNIIILTTLFLLVFLFRLLIALPAVKPSWQKFLLSLPLLGPFLQNVQLSAFNRNLGTMLQSGLPITSALEIIADTSENLIFRRYFLDLKEAVNRGKSLSSELASKRYKYIPSISAKMIGVGEKSGNLGDMFLYLGDFFEEEIDNTAKNFSTILEPVLLLIVGLIVAFLALAIISPIYQLTGSIRS